MTIFDVVDTSPQIVKCGWSAIFEAVERIAAAYAPTNVYGIPRGGCVPAAMLAMKWGTRVLNAPEDDCIIIDDIIDSGRTMDRFPNHKKMAIVSRPGDLRGVWQMEGWVEFPWEVNETGPEDSVVRLIEIAGADPNSEGLKGTPKRVLRALRDMTAGEWMKPEEILGVDFPADGYDEIVALSGVKFYSLCEHHMLPFIGEASVAYLPRERVVGLSKLARIVECFARRLQIQERMTKQIADSLEGVLKPLGVAVIVKAQHLCMGARGIQKADAEMTTSVMRGVFREKPEARAEVLRLLQKGGV